MRSDLLSELIIHSKQEVAASRDDSYPPNRRANKQPKKTTHCDNEDDCWRYQADTCPPLTAIGNSVSDDDIIL